VGFLLFLSFPALGRAEKTGNKKAAGLTAQRLFYDRDLRETYSALRAAAMAART